jgi:hypothetical protein
MVWELLLFTIASSNVDLYYSKYATEECNSEREIVGS